jgi:hypothetical protein
MDRHDDIFGPLISLAIFPFLLLGEKIIYRGDSGFTIRAMFGAGVVNLIVSDTMLTERCSMFIFDTQDSVIHPPCATMIFKFDWLIRYGAVTNQIVH